MASRDCGDLGSCPYFLQMDIQLWM